MQKLICFIFGHKWFTTMYTKYQFIHCSRCGKIKRLL
ncbi:MAG: DUF1660 family phage protein [Patescibacteria group bacterium]